ncbi:DUF1642 domain-containing protein [Lactiplantibacillus plantarum]|uniref:DUF1642 domain-containing protein n=1 Tax=Lactiplantibacillus plantarum TaxID=1590 RepID=UPI000A20336A|nr:DUF1642 domain-containing protein [Lactiplantibacillus plantarum]ARO06832.1 hypothetical protein BIZ33_08385 [Lactiplantibacillus plantarum]
MTKIYRKTATIKAEQFDPENGIVPQGVFDKEYEHTTSGMISAMVDELNTGKPSHNWHVKTLEGDLKINPRDWIATGIDGEHWPIADDVFKKTYAELPVIPKNVAKHIVTEHGLSDLIPICGGIYRAMIQTVVYGYQKGDIGDWIVNHSDVFARAWLDGYTVEEDK